MNGLYKAELIYSKRIWESVSEVELATMGWGHWWNTARLHEALDYRTPASVEASYTHSATTAPATVSPRNKTQDASEAQLDIEDTVAAHLSAPRLEPYLAAAGSVSGALRLYRWNLELSGAIHDSLGVVEVAMRNSIDAQLRMWNRSSPPMS